MKRTWFFYLVALATTLLTVLLQAPLTQLDGWMADRLQEFHGVRFAPKDIVLIEYDELTRSQAAEADLLNQLRLEDLQFWPLPRQVWGDVLQRLSALEVRAVGFDVLFDEPREGDDSFIDELEKFLGPVVLGVGIDDSDDGFFGLRSGLLRPHPGLIDVLPKVHEGHIAVLGRVGGVVRETPRSYIHVMSHLSDLNLPLSLSGRLHQVTGGMPSKTPSSDQWIDLLRFYGPPGSFRTVSLWELMEAGGFDRLQRSGVLRGATVLIANTTVEARDRHPTPFARLQGMSGVEIHATSLGNLRQKQHLLLLRTSGLVWLAFVIWAFGLTSIFMHIDRPMLRTFAALGGAGFVFLFALATLIWFGWLPPVGSLISIAALTGLLSTGEGMVRIQHSRRRMRMALSRYLSPYVMEKISQNAGDFDITLGGQSFDVVVLFSDVRGFTAMTTKSTKEGRVSEFVSQLNEYFTVAVEQLLCNDATVDKYIGDAILAYFGAPLQRAPSENATLAISSARRMVDSLDNLNKEWAKQGLLPWQQIIVLSYGSVICGNIGSPKRLDYTIIGDAVNCASRLEAVAKQFKVPIVATRDVVQLAGLEHECEYLGDFPIRGQEGVVSVYSVSVGSN